MTTMIAGLIGLVLFATALLHAYWGFGGLWPATDAQTLARTVVGNNGIRSMPPVTLTFVVAVLIATAGVWPALWTGLLPSGLPDWLLRAGMLVLTPVFLLRGLAGITPLMRRTHGTEPFASLNRRWFSPLITLIGAGLAILLVTHWR
ncbi:MAG: DUF3995 domain-containing protein [Notoacmeibacter sp.]|nr:DUF3995 domain-containing protein [Notoacmeibacter sp.]MCC0032344.1 DUF3995 domain-containing protein [Brucellaceae bacterium]